MASSLTGSSTNRQNSSNSMSKCPKTPGRRLTDVYARTTANSNLEVSHHFLARSLSFSSSPSKDALHSRTKMITFSSIPKRDYNQRDFCTPSYSQMKQEYADAAENINQVDKQMSAGSYHMYERSFSEPGKELAIYDQSLATKLLELLDKSKYSKPDASRHGSVTEGENRSDNEESVAYDEPVLLRKRSAITSNGNNNFSAEKEKYVHSIPRSSLSISRMFMILKYLLNIAYGAFRFIFLCTIVALIVTTLLFAIIFFIIFSEKQCEQKQLVQFDVETVKIDLERQVAGQHIAAKQIATVLKEFHLEVRQNPTIVWMPGWTGTGKSASLEVLTHSLSNAVEMQHILPTFLPQADNLLKSFAMSAVSSMNSCYRNIIIIDGWDANDKKIVIKFISSFLESVTARQDIAENLLIVVSGVLGSKTINREYVSLRETNVQREEMTLDHFLAALQNTDEYATLSNLGLKVHLAPFLPLEKEQVTFCVFKEVKDFDNSVNALESLEGHYHGKNIVNLVLDALQFLPKDSPLVSSTGCKKVSLLVRTFLSG